jgi:hypothetical protein
MADEIINKGPDGSIGEQAEVMRDVGKYQKWIKSAEKAKKEYNRWAKQGNRAYRGYDDTKADNELMANEQTRDSVFKYEINFIRQPIDRQITKTYARNPKFIAKPTAPIWVDAGPIQQQDPMTGQAFLMPQINPQTGLPLQNDISEQVCDVVEAVMEVEFKAANFKAEAKACTREAHHSPASIMQIGYQYNDQTGQDEIYFRRRPFKDFIIDPCAEVYEGVIRRCRYMGLKWQLTRDEAEAIGLTWSAISREENLSRQGDDDYDSKADVYQIWDKQSGVVVWVPANGKEYAKEPQPWPWELDGFPFEILKFTEDTDQQFSKPLTLAALPIQEELAMQREEISAQTTFSRPFTVYDPSVVDEDKMTAISRRGKGANIPINGLLGMPNSPIRREADGGLTQEYYAHYERNRAELVEVLGTSQNEALRTTKSTAAESQIVDQNAGNATSAKIDIQADFLNNCARKALRIMRQMYDTEKVTQITGRDNSKYWIKWIGAQILSSVDIEVETGSTEREDSMYNRQIALNMLEVMKGIPGIDIVKLGLDVLKEHGKRNADTYRIDMMPPQPQTQGMTGAGVGPKPGEIDQPAGVGATTGMDMATSVARQMNPMQ